jgi:hypothetical protein
LFSETIVKGVRLNLKYGFTRRLFHAKAAKEVSRQGRKGGFTPRPQRKFHAKAAKEVSRQGRKGGFTLGTQSFSLRTLRDLSVIA